MTTDKKQTLNNILDIYYRNDIIRSNGNYLRHGNIKSTIFNLWKFKRILFWMHVIGLWYEKNEENYTQLIKTAVKVQLIQCCSFEIEFRLK